MRQPKFIALSGIILAMFVIRVIPYVLKACGANLDLDILNSGLWNLSPLTAVCLLGGIYFRSRTAAILVPLSAWLLSSVAMCALTHDWQYLKYPGTPLVCGCFLLTSLLGTFLKDKSNVTKFAAGTGLCLLSECLFFVVTNGAEWALLPYYAPQFQYPMTAAGLLACYTAGLPFFKMSLLSSGLFFPLLFGGYALAQQKFPALQTELQPAKA
jgi:hypothetical protein